MKQHEGFLLREIAGVPYLLPYGQQIADHFRGIQINETGVYLWDLLAQERSREELLTLCAEHYQASPEELPELRQDIESFLSHLIAFRMIEPDESDDSGEVIYYLQIGGIRIHLIGPKKAYSKEFEPFSVPAFSEADLTIVLHIGTAGFHENGQLLIRNQELSVCERDDKYLLFFPQAEQILEAHLDKSGAFAHFYCMPPFASESFIYDFFHAIRLCFLYLAQQRGMVALHSASILYRGKAWLFSGRSGMGKSTHVNLWKESVGTPVINGDLNLIAVSETAPVVCGIPWCGTSGISDPGTYPLGGIILLHQAFTDLCTELQGDRKELLVSQRLISPSWTPALFDANLRLIRQLAGQIPVYYLECTKGPSAVEAIKTMIDKGLALTEEKNHA